MLVNSVKALMMGGDKEPLTLDFVAHKEVSDGANKTTWTITGVEIGTPSATRIVVISINTVDTSDHYVTSATIGGITATIAGSAWNTTSDASTNLIYAVVPTGTTATVVCTYNTNCDYPFLTSWEIHNANPVHFAAGQTTKDDGDTSAITMNTADGGCAIIGGVGSKWHSGAVLITPDNHTLDGNYSYYWAQRTQNRAWVDETTAYTPEHWYPTNNTWSRRSYAYAAWEPL